MKEKKRVKLKEECNVMKIDVHIIIKTILIIMHLNILRGENVGCVNLVKKRSEFPQCVIKKIFDKCFLIIIMMNFR